MSDPTKRPAPARRALDALQLVALLVGLSLAAFATLGAGLVLVVVLRVAIDWVGPLLLLGALLLPPWLVVRHQLEVRAQRRKVRQLEASYRAPAAGQEARP